MIASGYIERNDPYWPGGWQQQAIEIHKNWAASVSQSYVLITNEDVEDWKQYAANSDSWQFATLCKYKAIERFLQSDEQSFLWLDLDCIPEDNATFEPFEMRSTAYWAETNLAKILKSKDKHKLAKTCWHRRIQGNFLAVTTMLFSLNRQSARDLVRFSGLWQFQFGNPLWWRAYEDRKAQAFEMMQSLWSGECHVYDLGSQEAIFEDWINSGKHNVSRIGKSIVCDVKDPTETLFRHYGGEQKSLIATIESRWRNA